MSARPIERGTPSQYTAKGAPPQWPDGEKRIENTQEPKRGPVRTDQCNLLFRVPGQSRKTLDVQDEEGEETQVSILPTPDLNRP